MFFLVGLEGIEKFFLGDGVVLFYDLIILVIVNPVFVIKGSCKVFVSRDDDDLQQQFTKLLLRT